MAPCQPFVIVSPYAWLVFPYLIFEGANQDDHAQLDIQPTARQARCCYAMLDANTPADQMMSDDFHWQTQLKLLHTIA